MLRSLVQTCSTPQIEICWCIHCSPLATERKHVLCMCAEKGAFVCLMHAHTPMAPMAHSPLTSKPISLASLPVGPLADTTPRWDQTADMDDTQLLVAASALLPTRSTEDTLPAAAACVKCVQEEKRQHIS